MNTLRTGRRLMMVMAAVLSVTAGFAEMPKISGFVDTTYGYNFSKPASRTNLYRSYDNSDNTILLNNAQVTLQGALKEGVGYVVETNYGNDSKLNTPVGGGTANYFDVQEAYLTYKLESAPVDFKAGKFVAMHGIEVIESKDNFNVTRGFLFGLAEPFTHVGALATVSAPKVVNLSLGVTNGWDVAVDNNKKKTLMSRIGLNFGDPLSGGFVFMAGPEKAGNDSDMRYSFDTVWVSKPASNVTIAAQFDCGQEEHSSLIDGGASHWYGATLQPKVDITSKFGIGARYEWLQNLDGDRITNAAGAVLQNVALTPAVKLTESILFRTEYRYDWSSIPVFEVSDGAFSNSHQQTVTVELVYTF